MDLKRLNVLFAPCNEALSLPKQGAKTGMCVELCVELKFKILKSFIHKVCRQQYEPHQHLIALDIQISTNKPRETQCLRGFCWSRVSATHKQGECVAHSP